MGKVIALGFVTAWTGAFVIVNSAEFPHHQAPPLKPIQPAYITDPPKYTTTTTPKTYDPQSPDFHEWEPPTEGYHPPSPQTPTTTVSPKPEQFITV
jgi:hypothetical protein